MRKDKKRSSGRAKKVVISSVLTLAVVGALWFVTQGRSIPVLHPQGSISDQQFLLIAITIGLGFFVVIPVFILLFVIAWKYRAGNEKATYEPELEGNRKLEALWWGIPCLIILTLAVITWVSTHALDPYKPIESDVTPVKVQVVSLEWKWLFIYPDYDVATLNYMNIPKDTPIELSLTSDAPMNSFWVPALAGQIYTMTGMQTTLHIMANTVGSYEGSSANLSGEGFSDMTFKVNSLNETDFISWTRSAVNSSDMLTSESYAALAKPSTKDGQKTFMLMAPTLFDDIIMKYMMPSKSTEDTNEDSHSEPTEHTDTMDHMHMDGMDM